MEKLLDSLTIRHARELEEHGANVGALLQGHLRRAGVPVTLTNMLLVKNHLEGLYLDQFI
jgi:hypothetical protein